MTSLSRGLLVALLALACSAAPAVAGPTVSIRVEAVSAGTLVPTTQVALADGTFRKNATNTQDCNRSSIAGALEQATGGDWGGAEHPTFGQQIERVRSVTLPINGDKYWSVWINRRFGSGGNCDPVQQGDEIVLAATCAAAGATDCWSGTPLDLRAPATVRPGEAFSVDVSEVAFDANFNASDVPSSGATVSGGGASATTGADGRAALTVTQRGPVTLTATKPDNPREAVQVCVTDGADGFCGTRTPAGQTFGPATSEQSALVRDTTRPFAAISGLRDGRVFSRRRAPRVLRGSVDEAGGVLMVKLRLSRTSRGKCWSYSGKRERFVRRSRCGAERGWGFTVGDKATWEYQLARRLPRGRYVLDVNAVDRAYNRDDERRRGSTRVVFRVR